MTEKDNNCARYTELFFDYLERRDENEGEFDELIRHLETCEDCRRELLECEKMIAALGEAEAEPPAELRVGVMTRVKAEAKAYRRQRLLRRASGIAAALAICVGVVVAYNAIGFGMKFDAPASGGMNDAMGNDVAGDRVDAEDAGPGNSDDGFSDFIEDILGGANGGSSSKDEADADVDGVYPEDENKAEEEFPELEGADPGEEETDVVRVFYYADTVTDEAKGAFESAVGDKYSGGVVVLVCGDEAKTALEGLTEYFDVKVENGAVILDYELLSKAEAALYKLSAEYKGVYSVGYRLDGDEKCIVITTE